MAVSICMITRKLSKLDTVVSSEFRERKSMQEEHHTY